MTVIGIQRDERFSPNSVERDLAILRAVVEPLGGRIIPEGKLTAGMVAEPKQTVIFNMARDLHTIHVLSALEEKGARVVNPPEGIIMCARTLLSAVMETLGIPTPPAEGSEGYWLKRGDCAAQSHGDVVYCKDKAALSEAIADFERRGIKTHVVQAHVAGDLVKFYGVLGTGFFHACYPGDDGLSKFGDEQLNGQPHHYAYDRAALQKAAERLAAVIDVPVYGGDAIIREDGQFVVIDFNDWPSFSRCRDEAAEKIKILKD